MLSKKQKKLKMCRVNMLLDYNKKLCDKNDFEGFASFNDRPPYAFVEMQKWGEWFQNALLCNYFSYGNSMFLADFFANERNRNSCIEEALRFFFTIYPELDYCLLAHKNDLDLYLSHYFPILFKIENTSSLRCI